MAFDAAAETALLPLLSRLAEAAELFAAEAAANLRADVHIKGRIDRDALDERQHAAHGLAWTATYTRVFRQLSRWADGLSDEGRLGEVECLLAGLLAAEYFAEITGGLPMNGGEFVRPDDLGLSGAHPLSDPGLGQELACLRQQTFKTRIGEIALQSRRRATLEVTGLDDTFELIRDQFRLFSEEQIEPFAHGWHLRDELIPIDLIGQLSELGVFGLTISEAFGGSGLGKMAMCVVSEELSRGYIGVGSLATRSEIAAELISASGTDQQKAYWLPRIARGEVLPTAVFTEPDVGSDLAALKTQAVRSGESWRVSGSKTWITHAARADLMTILVRTKPGSQDHTGLSVLLASKPRGGEGQGDFPVEGLKGGEIAVLGYRGMKEYELAFDGFKVPAAGLLGDEEGLGFKQLMATFESARIQTAARAIGVAQSAFDLGLAYAQDRQQFGRSIFSFPRVHNKLAATAAELVGVRQLTYTAAARKDAGERCDLEAGMAKLLAARVAWTAADNALQIHGGNGFALEYPISRVLCDARILNIFEGAAEIQAQVIARRLLEL